VVHEHKEGLCCSSRSLIGHQEAAAISGLTDADALDSYLATGGFPKVVRTRMDRSLKDSLTDQLVDNFGPADPRLRVRICSKLVRSSQARRDGDRECGSAQQMETR
jgi:predicted AAA+ superfamily ATPase